MISLVVALLVHAIWFGLAWLFSRLLPGAELAPAQLAIADVPNRGARELAAENSLNQGEAKS
jgi:hypothetical protein